MKTLSILAASTLLVAGLSTTAMAADFFDNSDANNDGLVSMSEAQGVYNTLSSSTAQHSTNIVNGLITVQPGGYNDYPMTIPSGVTSAVLTGTFTASGGSGNDIDVFVVDQTNFVNWQNGHQANAYYRSGQVTTGTISASLPAGATYYLVYSNTFSSASSKNVQTTVNLSY